MEQDTNVLNAEEQEITFDPSDFGLEETETSETSNSGNVEEQEGEEKKAEELSESDTYEERGEEAKKEEEEGFEVKFLGETKRLSKEEAKTFAQKGLNYDHLQEEFNALKENALVKAALNSAKHSGMSEQDFANYLNERTREIQIGKISKERGIDEEAAGAVVDALMAEQGKADKLSDDVKQMQRENEQLKEYKRLNELKEEMRREWRSFSEQHPEYNTMDDLPDGVKESIKSGEALETAYMKYENAKLKEDLRKKSAAQKTPGAAAGTGNGEEEDDFLKGFFGKY